MRRIFNLLLAMLAIVGIACTPDNGDNGGNTTPMTFTMEVTDITSTGAKISVVPSSDDTYVFSFVDKAEYDEKGDNITAEVVQVLKDSCEKEGEEFGNMLSSGRSIFSLEGLLTADTEYFAYVFSLSKDGVVTSDIATHPFKTLAAEGINSGDMNLDSKIVSGLYVNYGDYYKVGAANWIISLCNESNMGVLTIDLQTDLSATEIPVGEYPINSSLAPETVVAGAMNDSKPTGTFWRLFDDNWSAIELACLKSGTVTIGKSNGNYTINVNALDSYGNTITASYSGAFEGISDSYNVTAKK